MDNVADDQQRECVPPAEAAREDGRVIDLSLAGKGNYQARRSVLVELVWFVLEACVINNKLLPLSFVRVGLLRLFGAKIGAGCRFVHPLRVKAPWNLEVGDKCWFGVDVWIYNQAPIRIGSNVCISQGTFLTAGSHDMSTTMDLRVAPIVIEDGVWITSKCVVQMGVTIGRSAVVTPLSVVHRSLEAEGVYGGNPCRFIRKRFVSTGVGLRCTPHSAH
ncbi:DapH/DapD/GlmU-related protein [Paraburkholderia sp. HP33-1]|uniref:DapH/DapD/GlmU-related protein n=1 Tax=Paraburkholderia sp. HP33-1 TaxID=2883243 RepID=UPI001F425458|nr:DapH/DapD/GlmU-related protein [Paraburkholderia sp. HP33-1]